MATSSASGGYLQPSAEVPPSSDLDLDVQLQRVVVGITTLPGEMVRPRWQPGNPRHPEPGTNWCAIGTARIRPDAGPAIQHQAAGNGSDSYTRHEELDVLATFYGPQAQRNALRMRDGISVPQNTEGLRAIDIRFVETSDIVAVPELMNQQWVRRYDLPIRLRRVVRRTYTVLNVLAAEIDIDDDTGHVNETILVP
ncbi:MAG: hypothetical protein Q8S92_22755 [Hydrogenophaga sp.]|uniref:phage neck terminator protein n=1 Tax=Hydrogenophaga sp. TaxID=1904254 RepID=UPI002735F64C|nr:hypothetical protein [Hydrogenophaga sp.]MDP3351816.1 hypothetical protein [Hydrogenophaga sp.]